MKETSSEPTPTVLPNSRRPPDQRSAATTGSAADWHFGSINDSLAFMSWEWVGEGPRCPAYWPVEDRESQYRCELRAKHPAVHFLSNDTL